jgi:hypothetical protein
VELLVEGLETRKIIRVDRLGQIVLDGARADGGLQGRLVVRVTSPCTRA